MSGFARWRDSNFSGSLAAFQITIPVRENGEILPGEIPKLSVLRYVQQSIPASSRWHSIFVRYLNQIAARVRGFGGNPDAVKPSPDGGEGIAEFEGSETGVRVLLLRCYLRGRLGFGCR